MGLLGYPLPGVEIGIAASAIVLGAMVLAELRPPLWLAALVVAFFAIFHGPAHGRELPEGASALLDSLGFVIATGLLHAVGILLGVAHRWPAGRAFVRVAGSWITAAGVGSCHPKAPELQLVSPIDRHRYSDHNWARCVRARARTRRGGIWPTGVDELIVPSDRPDGLGRVVNFKSIYFELPVFEYRPIARLLPTRAPRSCFNFLSVQTFLTTTRRKADRRDPGESANRLLPRPADDLRLALLLVMRSNLLAAALDGRAAGRLCLPAVDALQRRHTAAHPRPRGPGRRAGQAGEVSRDLLRGARSTQERSSRLPIVRRRAHPRGGRARRHRQAGHIGALAPAARCRPGARDSDTTASSPGSRRPPRPLRTCADKAMTSR